MEDEFVQARCSKALAYDVGCPDEGACRAMRFEESYSVLACRTSFCWSPILDSVVNEGSTGAEAVADRLVV